MLPETVAACGGNFPPPLPYESESFFITPAAVAVTESPPATIADQRRIFQMNGVAVINVQGKSNANWFRDQLLISPTLSTALIPALARYSIPPVPGATPWMQVESSIPFATLSSIFDQNEAINMSFAVDRWQIQTRPGIEAGTGQTLQNLLSGMIVDLAIRDNDAFFVPGQLQHCRSGKDEIRHQSRLRASGSRQ